MSLSETTIPAAQLFPLKTPWSNYGSEAFFDFIDSWKDIYNSGKINTINCSETAGTPESDWAVF